MRTTFSKLLDVLLAPKKLPAVVMTNIAFWHPKLNLNIKRTGKHLLQKKSQTQKMFELFYLYELANEVIQQFTLIAFRILDLSTKIKYSNKVI